MIVEEDSPTTLIKTEEKMTPWKIPGSTHYQRLPLVPSSLEALLIISRILECPLSLTLFYLIFSSHIANVS